MHNTVVMFSTSDHFTLKQVLRGVPQLSSGASWHPGVLAFLRLSLQDMCVVCGSFGRGSEGRLLPCSQCGQCYHPYCVGVKVRPRPCYASAAIWFRSTHYSAI